MITFSAQRKSRRRGFGIDPAAAIAARQLPLRRFWIRALAAVFVICTTLVPPQPLHYFLRYMPHYGLNYCQEQKKSPPRWIILSKRAALGPTKRILCRWRFLLDCGLQSIGREKSTMCGFYFVTNNYTIISAALCFVARSQLEKLKLATALFFTISQNQENYFAAVYGSLMNCMQSIGV